MFMQEINFTTQDILQKEFKEKRMGTAYDPTDVDSFLDLVIKDYETFNREISQLRAENEQLSGKVDDLTRQVNARQSVQSNVETSTSQANNSVTNMDILKRLSNLERHVFGSQLDNGANNQKGQDTFSAGSQSGWND
ncbi:cell division regulator GpsB [Lactobacillus rossiae]|uniref:Cell division regulator GpsB n=3 Tax=Furfurilactobacillus TaxID=2767882 RepID=A0A6N9I304_9LACO|nr:cell division regulator GpsB [Furfurilactobacillus milii]MYV16733.1 cell division regulator GpsB [Furfurilactobacillus milii]